MKQRKNYRFKAGILKGQAPLVPRASASSPHQKTPLSSCLVTGQASELVVDFRDPKVCNPPSRVKEEGCLPVPPKSQLALRTKYAFKFENLQPSN